VPPFVSSLRLIALMVFIALVAVAVWLADLRLAVALPLVAVAWIIAATIEWLAWRSARGPVAVVEATSVSAAPVAPPVMAEPEPAPIPDLAPPVAPRFEAPPEPEPEPEVEPEPAPPPEASAEPEPEGPSEPQPEALSEPEPPAVEEVPASVEEAPVPVAALPVAEAERPRWARRKRLRAVPSPPLEEPPAAPEAPAPVAPVDEAQVVSFPQRSYHAREWNIWDLERLARAEAPGHPERRDEWAFLFVHLRQFANADGVLPSDFDSLVRESFGDLLERQLSR
jgi:hypothetical protein